MVRVVSQVPGSHILKDLAFVSLDVVRPGLHYPPLPHHSPRPMILAPHPPSREEVPHKIFQPCRFYRRGNISIPSQSVCPFHINIEVPQNNQLRPYRSLCHRNLHILNRPPVSWRQLTSDNVPAPLPCCQLACNGIFTKLVYCLNHGGGEVLVEK